jgi:hypothetical protein
MDKVTRPKLESMVGHVSQTAVKHWLKVSGLEHTAQNTDEFYQLLSKLLDDKKITIEQLQDAALEIEENGNKRVYLGKLKGVEVIKDKANFERHIRTQGFSLAEKPDKSIKIPPEPTLNYVFWSKREVRVKFSETHSEFVVDYENQRLDEKRETKFALALVNPDSGFTQIRLDPPGQVHPHKDPITHESNPTMYEEFYRTKFLNILGGQELELCDLKKAAKWLVTSKQRVFRLPHELVRTGANSRQRYSSRLDVRDDPARQGAASADLKNWIFEGLDGYWIPERSRGRLQRELFMSLKRRQAMVRFLADCLAPEVNYALSRIKAKI